LSIGIVGQICVGLGCIVAGAFHHAVAGWQFGLAIILSYPIIWAHMLPIIIAAWWLAHPKRLAREIVCSILESQVRRLRKKNTLSVVAVAGSIGKTSTKIAIARLLQATQKVQWQEGNYNDRATVPLIFFGHAMPGLLNIFAWMVIMIKNERIIAKPYPYQYVVAEIGTDGPGQLQQFAYLNPELVVVTAVTAEHMEYFGTLDAVAAEELSTLTFAKQALVNIDDTPPEYLHERTFRSYGLEPKALYHVTERTSHGLQGQKIKFQLGKKDITDVTVPLLGQQGAKIALAAVATAHCLGLSSADIEKGAAAITAFAGRMQILHGIRNSTLIDDTYNSSPVATKAALDVLQGGEAPQRIAILGSMNELGDYSPDAHKEVGEHCDPAMLDWVITVGDDAKKYLAPAAKARGCQVTSFLDPYKAGTFVKEQLKEGAVVLAKGSQNKVFTEESLKVLLADKADAAKLVRQSRLWMTAKSKQFTP
jgi:UDP-N-acetylmuramoyl-tripeptide--D-alanyl-D-alanine ligase